MKYLQITLSDGSKWGVPVDMIAWNRAKHYAEHYNGSIKLSLEKDTLPLFDGDHTEIIDWVESNMNWLDFNEHQIKIADATKQAIDFPTEWLRGKFDVVDVSLGMSGNNKNTQPLPDCNNCTNRGQTNGLSQESYCSSCKWRDNWKLDHYSPRV